MIETASRTASGGRNDEITLLGIAALLLRGRRTILTLAAAGAGIAIAYALLKPPVFTSSATFIPEEVDKASSGLAQAASQFGIQLPGNNNGWSPSVYAELLKSRALIEPLALDTIAVPEEGGKRLAVMDLLDVKAPTLAKRTDVAVRALASHISATEEKSLGGVRVVVKTRWPTVSFFLADRLVKGVGRFNVERRKSQGAAERQFVDGLASDAEVSLRAAEDELQSFLQRNRVIGSSPQLSFEHDRLQRQVALRQQIYTSLLQNREEARIREVRDTPVITVLEEARVPAFADPRHTFSKMLIGILGGVLLGSLITFLAQGLAGARTAPNQEEREFFEALAAATPRFGRPRFRRSKRDYPRHTAKDQT